MLAVGGEAEEAEVEAELWPRQDGGVGEQIKQ